EGTLADPPDHRAVPAHEGFQGRGLFTAHEALQQLSVGQVRPLRQPQDGAEVLQDPVHSARRHPTPLRAPLCSKTRTAPFSRGHPLRGAVPVTVLLPRREAQGPAVGLGCRSIKTFSGSLAPGVSDSCIGSRGALYSLIAGSNRFHPRVLTAPRTCPGK